LERGTDNADEAAVRLMPLWSVDLVRKKWRYLIHGESAPTPARRKGLCKIPADVITKARDDTAAQVNRILLTFVTTTLFCLLALLTPDSALLTTGGEKLNVPFAGSVSFFGFVLLAPTVLIILRVYLQIYAEHEHRLNRVVAWIPTARAPIVTPDKNPLLRTFRGLAFYALLPIAMLAFWWKAAVFPGWGMYLFVAAAAVIAVHLSMLVGRLSWRSRAVFSLGAAIAAFILNAYPLLPSRRPFDLFRANLSDQWLVFSDLRGANLGHANLARVVLFDANLTGAHLYSADLTGATLPAAKLIGADLSAAKLIGTDLMGADLTSANLEISKLSRASLIQANLTGANLTDADLTDADLTGADLTGTDFTSADLTGAWVDSANLAGANLTRANLSGARKLTQQQLDTACGDADAKLPTGMKLKSCH
jgi:uncharacterized protein YjbI with pentapeptide repeats